MKGFFITGTDTGVGKTCVTGALAKLLSKNFQVGVFKPVQTGVQDLSRSDAFYLFKSSKYQGSFDDTYAYSFAEPVAPFMAGEHARSPISMDIIREKYNLVRNKSEVILVEGAGGLMVPLANGVLIADLVIECNLPLLIVARPDLGTVNHTLLTVHTARSLGISVCGIIINGFNAKAICPDISETISLIRKYGAVEVLGVIPLFDVQNMTAIIHQVSLWMEEHSFHL